MKHLYIIGNGFDIHHKINSRYSDFKNWLSTTESPVLCTIEEVFGDIDSDWWNDFESNLASVETLRIAIEEANQHYPDISSEEFRDADWYEAEFAVEQRLEDAYNEIREAFQLWVLQLSEGNKTRKININIEDSIFMSFNYSGTLENLYGIPNDNILYIHGKAATNDTLIIGHGVSLDELENRIKVDEPSNNDDNGDSYDYVVEQAKEAAIIGVHNQRKNIDEIINNNQDWFLTLTDVTHIHIYGHSLADVDMPYFKKIISSVKKNEVKFEFSDYRGENKLKIESFMQAEGISSDNYTIVELDSLLINSDA